MKFPFLDAKARLVRIMGTFDLATGHGDTMDELLDSLESELRGVFGHYREALKQQRTWVGLTPQERDEINEQVYGAVPHHVAFHHAIEAKLKEKNT